MRVPLSGVSCPSSSKQEARCSAGLHRDPIPLRHRHRKAQLQRPKGPWWSSGKRTQALLTIFTDCESAACFSAPSKKTLTSPFFPGQLHIPAGGHALHRREEGIFGPYSVQSEWERHYQRREQRPLPGPNHLHAQHWQLATANAGRGGEVNQRLLPFLKPEASIFPARENSHVEISLNLFLFIVRKQMRCRGARNRISHHLM